MKRKRICALLLSGVLALGAILAPMPQGETGVALLDDAVLTASAASNMRRPCSSEQPMLIVHIDTWNVADPAKIIATIPEDIKPYVVFNISLSINWNKDNNMWLMVQDGYECAKSWLRTCADENVWCMVQPASGGQCHFPDYDASGNIVASPNQNQFVSRADADYENTIYAEFFRDYPNFIGFNYSEQFWGFESEDFKVTPIQRYQHFANLLKLCNKYGGYLNVNWCANQWSAPLNPVAMLKRCPEWRTACEKYSENLQLEEKYTQGSFIEDVESEVLGAYLSGYCGNFGVRYDETGWTDGTQNKDYYRQITGLPIHLERMVFNGATVIDGPELIWADDFKEIWGGTKDSEGYTCRAWDTRDQYVNATLDFFRMVTDGTIRIPTRQEVIDRTKVVIIQDNASGDDHNKYSTYASLFEGLYRMPGDGNLRDNTNPFKCTGRYPTIPTVYALRDDTAKSFDVQLKQSSLPARWSSIAAKQDEFNKLFPSEYTGNCYAGRYENAWVTYNPNKKGDNCGGVLSLKYNTCKSLDVNFNAYGNALIHEYSDHIDIYANNFDNKAQTTLKTDTFKIAGCSTKPTYTAKDTGRNQTKSEITESYANGTYTLTVKHNGPVHISIKCSGTESGRLTTYKTAKLTAPAAPAFYTGTRQYEAELFDLKNTDGYVANACGSGVTKVQGQGFLKFGTKANAAAKDTVSTTKAGTFTLKLRYAVTSDVGCVDLYVNGTKAKTLSLAKGSNLSDWRTVSQEITLKAGENKVELKATAALPSALYIDNFTVDGDFGDATATPPIVPQDGTLIKNLVVQDTANAASWSIVPNFGQDAVLFGDRDFTCTALPAHLIGAEMIQTACDSKLTLTDLATFTAGADITVYAAVDSRVAESLPAWLAGWQNTDTSISTSNELTLTLFKKNVKAGTSITLGTNGGSNESVNYIVLAIAQEDDVIKGDVNFDGVVDAFDLSLAKQLLLTKTADVRAEKAADLDGSGTVTVADATLLQAHLLRRGSTAL